jgi:hypothetical protein
MFRINFRTRQPFHATIWLLIIACILVAPASMTAYAATQASYYVSPGGSDNNPGTEALPFKTIAKARDVVRTVNRPMTGDIYVYLRCGTYYLTAPVQFTVADGGANGFSVIYKAYNNEAVVISGGEIVTGWTVQSGAIYKATLNRTTKLRGLYVNGVRATMTETVQQAVGTWGTFTVAGTEPWAQTSGTTFDGLEFMASSLPAFANPGDVEIEWHWQWCDNIATVRDMVTIGDTTIVKMQQPTGAIAAKLRWCWLGVKDEFNAIYKYSIRNAFELLKSPGQFYFNKATKTLYYYSRAGENMSTATVIAPLSEGLISISGESTTNRAKNLQFYGLCFMHDHYLLTDVAGSRSFVGSQSSCLFYKFRADGDHSKAFFSNEDLPQATIFTCNCDSLRIEKCKFLQIGSPIGVNLENDVVHSTVIGNVFKDIMGAAVNIAHPQHYKIGDGPKYPSGKEGICQYNVVKDNFVKNNSLEFHRVEGITAYHVQDLEISHNYVHYSPYGTIAVGWCWKNQASSIPPSTVMGNIKINYNNVGHDHLTLSDGGALYTMNDAPNSQVVGNYTTGGSTGILPDEGAGLWNISNNVFQGPGGSWIVIWSSIDHDMTIDNNYTSKTSFQNNGVRCSITNTHNESTAPPWSSAAQAIINAAGIESTYQSIMSDTLAPQACPVSVMENTKNSNAINNFSVRILGNRIMFPQEFSGKSFSVNILDLRGRLIQKMIFDKGHPATAAQRIDLSKGSYLVKCIVDSRVATQKVVNVK